MQAIHVGGGRVYSALYYKVRQKGRGSVARGGTHTQEHAGVVPIRKSVRENGLFL